MKASHLRTSDIFLDKWLIIEIVVNIAVDLKKPRNVTERLKSLYLHSPVFLLQIKLSQLTVGWPSVHALSKQHTASHLLGFIHTCLLQPRASVLLAALLEHVGHSVLLLRNRRKLTAGKRQIIVQVRHVYPTVRCRLFVWQNVTLLNCARSMTLRFRLFLRIIFLSLLFSLLNFQHNGGKAKTRAEQTGRRATGAILVWQFYSAWQQFW